MKQRFNILAALVVVSVPMLASAQNLSVAGELKSSGSVQLLPMDQGAYTFVITQPMGTFFQDPKVPGTMQEADTARSAVRKGKPVWNVPYSKAPAYFEGATVHLCKLQGEWSCGSGEIDKILTRTEDKSWASGTIQGGKLIIKVKPSPENVAKYQADPTVNLSVEGQTMVIIPKSGPRSWLTIHDSWRLWTLDGKPAWGWIVDLKSGAVKQPSEVPGVQTAFEAVVKE